MLVVVFNPLCPVRFSYCYIVFTFAFLFRIKLSVSVSVSVMYVSRPGVQTKPLRPVAAPAIFSWGELNLGHMTSARSASLYGGLGAQPPAGSRGRAPGGGSAGRSPSEAVSSLAFGRPSDEANLHHFRNFAVTEPHIFFIYIPTVSRETIFSTP